MVDTGGVQTPAIHTFGAAQGVSTNTPAMHERTSPVVVHVAGAVAEHSQRAVVALQTGVLPVQGVSVVPLPSAAQSCSVVMSAPTQSALSGTHT